MSTNMKSPDQKCGEYMEVLALRLEYIKEAWIPYCQRKIGYEELETIRKGYNKKIKSLIQSFENRGKQ